MLRHGVGGHGHNHRNIHAQGAADFLGGGDAVQHRHLHVHQHQVPVAGRLQNAIDGDAPVFGNVHLQTGRTQQFAGYQLVEVIVFHQQHARTGNRRQLLRPNLGCRCPFGAAGAAAALGKRRAEPKGGAAAELRLDAHATVHQAGQVFADGQAQTGAAVLAGGGAVGLLKALEQLVHLLLAQAYAGVAHLKAQRHLLALFGHGKHGHTDFTAGGELDGVIGKVDQDLAQAQGIAVQSLRHARLDVKHQPQALGPGLVAHQVGELVQYLA